AFSWGGQGHHVVGMIADLILQSDPVAREKIRSLLGDVSLSEAAVRADCAKGFRYCRRDPTPEERTYAEHNPRHHSFHYTDVPIQQSKYAVGTPGTGADDVVQIIRYATSVLRNQAPLQGPATLNQREALWVLAHLVGDIHQPLHVGSIYFDR